MATDVSRLLDGSIGAATPSGDHIEVLGGPEDGRTFPLREAPVTVGRAPENAIVLALDPSVSRRHAVFERDGDQWTVRDVGSTHGTTVDGAPVRARVPLRDGSILVLGTTALCARLVSGEAE
jgi:pSer/pThr/pTyr-binding forkhead associated (FHA) protein